MSHVDISFYVWLAAQPAFVEVAVGVAFVLVLAPAVLAVVAQLITRLEDWVLLLWQPQQSPAPTYAHRRASCHVQVDGCPAPGLSRKQ